MFVAAVSFFVGRVEFQVGVLAAEVFMCLKLLLLLLHFLLHEIFLQFDWLRAVVFQLNLKNLHVKITNLLWVVV